MTIMSNGVRSEAWRRAAGHSSIREVCLVGIKPGRSAPSPEAAAALEGGVASGMRMTWSGRPYCVAATQVLAGGGDERCRYLHLSALAEG
jgi:hypothetical protein